LTEAKRGRNATKIPKREKLGHNPKKKSGKTIYKRRIEVDWKRTAREGKKNPNVRHQSAKRINRGKSSVETPYEGRQLM